MVKIIIYFVLIFSVLFTCSGCNLFENLLTDISGWDLSACASHLSVCLELFYDNKDQLLGGFDAAEHTLEGV